MAWASRKAEKDFENQRRELDLERARRGPVQPEQSPQGQSPAPQPAPGGKGNGSAVGLLGLLAVLAALVPILVVIYAAQVAQERQGEAVPFAFTQEMPEFTGVTGVAYNYSLEDAIAGDRVRFADRFWRVLERQEDLALLLLEDEIYLRGKKPEDIRAELNAVFDYDERVGLGELTFPREDFERIQKRPDWVFLLTGEEMEQYGVKPPEGGDGASAAVRPAMWVSIH